METSQIFLSFHGEQLSSDYYTPSQIFSKSTVDNRNQLTIQLNYLLIFYRFSQENLMTRPLKYGPTGPITRHEFRELIEPMNPTECRAHVVSVRGYYVSGRVDSVVHFHWFNEDRLEVGYWSPDTNLGFIFADTPRKWSGDLYHALKPCS